MKKKFVVCLIIGMMAVPVMLFAESGRSQPSQAVQGDAVVTSLHDDIVAMRNDLERLYEETDALAEQLEGTRHSEAAAKIQEHVSSVIQRTRDMEKKMDAESGGVMASFREEQAKDGINKDKQGE